MASRVAFGPAAMSHVCTGEAGHPQHKTHYDSPISPTCVRIPNSVYRVRVYRGDRSKISRVRPYFASMHASLMRSENHCILRSYRKSFENDDGKFGPACISCHTVCIYSSTAVALSKTPSCVSKRPSAQRQQGNCMMNTIMLNTPAGNTISAGSGMSTGLGLHFDRIDQGPHQRTRGGQRSLR